MINTYKTSKINKKKEVWYVFTMEYYSAIQKDKSLPFSKYRGSWRDHAK